MNIRMLCGISRTILWLLWRTTVCVRFMKIGMEMCGFVQTTASTFITELPDSCSISSSMIRPANIPPLGHTISFRIGRVRFGWLPIQGGIFVIEKPRLMAAIAHASSGTATCVADYHFSDKGQNALSGLHVGQIVLDGKGMIWASSHNHLDRIDPYTMRVTHVGDNAPINYLMASDNGNVWVGYNASVKCYMVNLPTRGKDVDSKEWKIGDKVVSMCDVEGKIWVASGNTCCVLDPKNNSFRFIIPMVTPTNIYYSKLNHEVVMGGNDGFVSIRTDLNMPKDEKAQLLLAGIVVNGRQTQDALLDESIKGTPGISPVGLKTLVLKSDENSFTLQLTDLPFADHPTAVYAYRLEGSDASGTIWIRAISTSLIMVCRMAIIISPFMCWMARAISVTRFMRSISQCFHLGISPFGARCSISRC